MIETTRPELVAYQEERLALTISEEVTLFEILSIVFPILS